MSKSKTIVNRPPMALVVPPSVSRGVDNSYLPEIRKALANMRKVCRARNIENPVDILVPEDALLDQMPPLMLEQAAVMCAWPGVDIRIGGIAGKIQEGTGARGRVLIFFNRKETVMAAVDYINKAAERIGGGNDPGTPAA